MKEYIEREAAIGRLDELERTARHNSVLWSDHVEECREALRDVPAVDVRPVVRSSWEQVEVNRFEDMDEDMQEALAIASMFCPNCKRYHNEVYFLRL